MRSSLSTEVSASGRNRLRWGRVEQLPFSRVTAYELINSGLIVSVLMTWPGSRRGVRLIDLDSLDAYLEKLAAEQLAGKAAK
jgi:hypothetical protein